MGQIWSEERKFLAWLDVEKGVCEAWSRRDRIPATAMEAIRSATVNIDRIQEIERVVDHDVIAFMRAVGETAGDSARYIHLGLTSSDVVDTGLALQVRDASRILLSELERLIAVLARQAVTHEQTMMIGRTHGVHAEPTTFGLKLAIWYDELRRQRRRLELASADMAVGKLSGAVGTHAHIPLEIEEEVCTALGLRPAPVTNQIIQRDRHAFYISVLAGLGSTLEKIAVEIRHLQRTEVREVAEPFAAGNQGSSAMPHKRNPHESERIAGLSRLLRGYATTAMENVALWHERDISHSSTERVIFPDACIVLDYMLALTADILDEMDVDAERMAANMELTGGAIYSQAVMLALVDAGMDRQAAYRLIQRFATEAWSGGSAFREAIETDPHVQELLTATQIDMLFDPRPQLARISALFDRLGLTENRVAGASLTVDEPSFVQ